MQSSESLWDCIASHFEKLFLFAYKEWINRVLSNRLSPLASAFMGCAINIQQNDNSIQTEIHQDIRERPFVPSCLCSIGDFRGGDLIL